MSARTVNRLIWAFFALAIVWLIVIPVWQTWLHRYWGSLIFGGVTFNIGFFTAALLAAGRDPSVRRVIFTKEERAAIGSFLDLNEPANIGQCRDWGTDLIISALDDLVAEWKKIRIE